MTHDQGHLCLCNFSPDEREVLQFMADRIDKARAQYGPLQIDSDERDWDWEEHLENVDGSIYRAIGIIKKRRARKKKP